MFTPSMEAWIFGHDDKLNIILNNITPKVRQELTIHLLSKNPETILNVMDAIYGEHRSFVELTTLFFKIEYRVGDAVVDFSHCVHRFL